MQMKVMVKATIAIWTTTIRHW